MISLTINHCTPAADSTSTDCIVQSNIVTALTHVTLWLHTPSRLTASCCLRQVIAAIRAGIKGEGSDALLMSFYNHPAVITVNGPEVRAEFMLTRCTAAVSLRAKPQTAAELLCISLSSSSLSRALQCQIRVLLASKLFPVTQSPLISCPDPFVAPTFNVPLSHLVTSSSALCRSRNSPRPNSGPT
jgi:hypothetical protein